MNLRESLELGNIETRTYGMENKNTVSIEFQYDEPDYKLLLILKKEDRLLEVITQYCSTYEELEAIASKELHRYQNSEV